MATLKSIETGAEVYSDDAPTVKETLQNALAAGVDLSFIDLRGADLSGAILDNAELKRSSLVCAKLDGASCKNVDFGGANLGAASMKNVDLTGAKMITARVDYAIFSPGVALIYGCCGVPVFVNKTTTEVGGYQPMTNQEWLTMTDEQILEMGGQSLLNAMPNIRSFITEMNKH